MSVEESAPQLGTTRRHFALAGGGLVGLNIGARLFSLGTAVMLARFLGPEQYGIYVFAMAVVTVLSVPVQFGLPNLLVRLIAVYQKRGEYSLLKGLVIRSNQWVFGLAIAIAAGGLVTIAALRDLPNGMPKGPMFWAFGVLPFLALSGLRGATLRALRNPVLGHLPEQIVRPAVYVVLILLVALNGTLSPTVAVALNIVATAVAFLVGAGLLLKVMPSEVVNAHPEYQIGRWAREAAPFLVLAGSQTLGNDTDVVLLGMMASPADVGIYRIAVQGAALTLFAVNAVGAVAAPHFARVHDAADHSALERLAKKAARATFVASAPLLIAMGFGGKVLLGLLFGEQYLEGAIALGILVGGNALGAALGYPFILLSMSGLAWYATASVIVSSALRLVINLSLIPIYGLEGAAVATVASGLGSKLLLYYWVRQKLGIDCSVLPLTRAQCQQ